MEAFEAEDIRARLGNTDAYARLSKVWRERIVPEGPPAGSEIGRFSTSAPDVWSVHAIAPAIRDAFFFVRSVIDALDNDEPVLFAPALLVARRNDTIFWVDVINARALASHLEQTRRCAEFVTRALGVKLVGVGPKDD